MAGFPQPSIRFKTFPGISATVQGAKPPATDRIKCAGRTATISMAQTSVGWIAGNDWDVASLQVEDPSIVNPHFDMGFSGWS